MEIRQKPELAPAAVFAHEIDAFIAHKLARNEYSQRSAGVKVHAIKELAAATGRANPVQATAADVTTFYRRLQGRVAESTAQGYVVTARSFFNWMVAEGKMRRNPVAEGQLDRHDPKGRDKFCTATLQDQLIASTPSDDLKLILYLGFHAGLRENEIIEARPEWFDLERGLLTIKETKTFRPKDREQRTIPLTGAFKAFLTRYGLPGPFVLHSEAKYGKNVYRYDFKKSFATHMKANGCP